MHMQLPVEPSGQDDVLALFHPQKHRQAAVQLGQYLFGFAETILADFGCFFRSRCLLMDDYFALS